MTDAEAVVWAPGQVRGARKVPVRVAVFDETGQVDPDDPESALLVYDSGVLHGPAPAAPGEQAHC